MSQIQKFAISHDMKPAVKWILCILSVLAFALSLWLTIQKWTGNIDSLAGCGSDSDCANVLGSKWSMVMGLIPVSVFSCLLYLVMVVSLWVRGDLMIWLRSLFAWILVSAAVWFIGLQLIVMQIICPYCMVVHGLGVSIGLVVLLTQPRGKTKGCGLSVTLLPAALLVAALALTQHYGPAPETHRLAHSSAGQLHIEQERQGEEIIHAAGDGRLVFFMDKTKSYRVEQLPHLGEVDADHVLVKYFDYTCEACFTTHKYLDDLMVKYSGQLAVIVLPVPLERACNPHLLAGLKDHPNACKFAALSLRVWKASPEMFAEFHRSLFECREQPYEVAEAIAYSLVDPDKLDAVDDAWIKDLLQQNITDYASFVADTPVMPKLLIKDSLIVHGKTKDGETLETLLQKHLRISQ